MGQAEDRIIRSVKRRGRQPGVSSPPRGPLDIFPPSRGSPYPQFRLYPMIFLGVHILWGSPPFGKLLLHILLQPIPSLPPPHQGKGHESDYGCGEYEG